MPLPSTTILPRPVVAVARSVPAAGSAAGAEEGVVVVVEHPARISTNNAAPVKLIVSFDFTLLSFDKGASADAELGQT